MKLTYTAEDMTQELDKYGVGYKYPISCSVVNMTGFLADSRNVRAAFMAVSDDSRLLLVELPLLSGPQYYGIPIASIQSVKIKKMPLLKSYNITLKFLHEGKVMTYRISMAAYNSSMGKFQDQPQNVEDMREYLQSLN